MSKSEPNGTTIHMCERNDDVIIGSNDDDSTAAIQSIASGQERWHDAPQEDYKEES